MDKGWGRADERSGHGGDALRLGPGMIRPGPKGPRHDQTWTRCMILHTATLHTQKKQKNITHTHNIKNNNNNLIILQITSTFIFNSHYIKSRKIINNKAPRQTFRNCVEDAQKLVSSNSPAKKKNNNKITTIKLFYSVNFFSFFFNSAGKIENGTKIMNN